MVQKKMVNSGVDENILPRCLVNFMRSGESCFRTEDGDWQIQVELSSGILEKTIPQNALVIARNGCGDYLYIVPDDDQKYPEKKPVFVYWHDEKRSEQFTQHLELLTVLETPTVSEYKKIFYFGGEDQVMLGDEVTARDLFFKRTGRVAYVPGISKKNSEFEHGGLTWIAVRFPGGSTVGIYVDPETSWVKKSCRFIRRSDEPFEKIKPRERFD